MDMKEIIRTRKSVRTFDGKPLSAEDKTKILNYVETIANPYNIPVKFVWLDKNKHGLSSPVIVGEDATSNTKKDIETLMHGTYRKSIWESPFAIL